MQPTQRKRTTTALSTSLAMDGSTRSSKSSPSCCARQGRVSRAEARRSTASAAPHRVDARQLRNLRPRQHSQRQVHLLQVCAGTRASSVSETALALGTAVAFRPAGARCGSGAPAAAREGCSCVRGAALLCAVACGRPPSGAPLVPVTELMLRGRVRMSKMTAFCSHGTRKWVPSPDVSGSTPFSRSKSTACSPPSTALGLEAPRVRQRHNDATMRARNAHKRTCVHRRLRQRSAHAQNGGPARQVAKQAGELCRRRRARHGAAAAASCGCCCYWRRSGRRGCVLTSAAAPTWRAADGR